MVGERVSAAPVTGRLAPSPTGRMHLGNAYAALAAWLGARAAGGRVLLRIEDIDAPRVVRDADRWIMDDLAWLGLDWDGEPVYQSRRLDLYEDVLCRLQGVTLDRRGRASVGGVSAVTDASDGAVDDSSLVYPCFCSRADIRAASAPNEGDGFLIYPGTCRRLGESERGGRLAHGDRHSWRIAVPDASAPETSRVVAFDDLVFGPQRFDLTRQVGDVVVRRSDGLFAYQLAVSVDDLSMGVTQVVRGRDLLRSTAIQLWIRRWVAACGAEESVADGVGRPDMTPEFAHLPLIDAADGRRMAKRLNSLDLGTLRERGVDPRAVVGYCAWLLRVVDEPRPMTPDELVPAFSWDGVRADTSDRVVDADESFR
ncbi:glutamyl-Q tRNA(Asp) synthetase [Bifidobacterium pullorum]|uniref:glutamyl-Q tRNA(Asp) synthetase n=1 Tax=Bifidobacterium pullorum TaxID=78448 RepID=UPI0038732BD7